MGVVGFAGTDYSVSKQEHAQQKTGTPDASASKHNMHPAGTADGCAPRGVSTPRASRSTDALAFGVVGLVGMMASLSMDTSMTQLMLRNKDSHELFTKR